MTPKLRRARTVVSVLIAATVLAITACGDSEQGGAATTSADVSDLLPPNVVTDADIDAEDQGSPGRALLEWWQAFQFGDGRTVVDLTDPSTVDEFGEGTIEGFAYSNGPSLGKPKLLKTVPHDRVASVRVLVVSYPEEGKPEGSVRTFLLRREGNAWLVRPDTYFAELEEAAKAAE